MSKKEMFELTNPQKSIWMMEQFYNGTNINNICATLTINMDVDIEKLNKAINIFIQNNKSFGLNFKIENGEIKQYFTEIKDIEFECFKLKDTEEVKQLARETAEELFDIEGERLFVYKLYKLENGYGGFVVMTHHLISDAATMSIMGKEVIEIYSKLISKEDIEEKEYTYKQYIREEKEYLQSSKFIKDKEYWNEKFSTVPEVASIPVTAEKTHTNLRGRAEREEFILDVDLLTKISQFCNQNKISNFNFFMTVYAIYLSRVSNLKDFVIGTPILNRTNFKEKHTTGMFINTAPLRIKIEENIDFISLTKSISQSSMSMLRYQKYSYQMLLEDLRKRDNSIPTLYDVMLSYQVTKANDRTSKIPYEVEWIPSTTISNPIYIHLHDNDDDGQLNIAYDYQIEKYTKQDILNIHNRILYIIEQVLQDVNLLEKDIEIVTPEEKNQILNVFNDTYVDYPRDKTIVDLFEEQVEKTPDNIAVVCGEDKITYKELNEKANSLASYLIEQGVKTNNIVGILINRTIEMIIAILATLKSGGAYIPMDPQYPENRVKYMLEDSKCKLVLSTKEIYSRLNIDIPFVDIRKQNSEIYNKKVENLNIKINKENLSYIIYTSGSTGKPKGVMLTHKGVSNLVNYCNGYVEYLKNNKYQSIVSVTTVSFDIFFFESIISLQKGLKVVIANEEEQMIPRLLVDLISRENIKIIQTTPSRMKLLLNNIENKNDINNLEYIILAGEQFPISLAEELRKINNMTLYNGYGPSETTVFSTLTDVTNVEKMTIGRPLNNTQIYVLDKQMNICPIRVPGEIYISGDGVGKGYVNREELTKKSYLENKFNDYSLLYKTGDLGAYNEDGTLNCLGRIDNQVKIRGQRIELEEIEKAILNISQIKDCVVAKKEDENGHEFLCAYYIKRLEIEPENIRKTLRKTLTNYMMPQYFVELEKLPYTPNGKIDRKLLPIPRIEERNEEIDNKNESETEKKVKEIYEEIFKIQNLSIEDDFFELGGDSLLAIKLSSKIFEKMNIQVGIKNIFDNPTIRELAKIINLSNKKKNYEIKRVPKKEYYPVSSAQRRMYYSALVDGKDSILYNISGGMILDEKPDIGKLNTAFRKLIKNNSSLRTYFEVIDDEIVQKISDTVEFELQEEKVNHSKIEEITKEFIKPFDLAKAPLFRAKVINLKNGKTLLLLDMHHIISDGKTIRIIAKELTELYNGKIIKNKEIEYKDFAVWENKKQFKEQEKYWLSVYEDKVPTLELPTNYSRPATQSFEGKSIIKKLDKEFVNSINNTCQKLNITPYMLLIGVYYILLSEYAASNDIVIGTPVVGRHDEQLENIIGMFVNTLALRNKIKQDETFEEMMIRIKENCLKAFENQDYPLDRLVKKLNLPKEPSRNVLFDVLFTYQSKTYPVMNFDGIKAEFYVPETEISKFDISLEAILSEEELTLRFEYCTKLFSREFIEKMQKHYINILKLVLKDEKIKISNIDMISREEKRHIINKINNTQTQYEKNKTVSELFEEQVQRTPNKIAVVFDGKKLTYRELNNKANQLATYMKEKYNVEEQDKVAIFVKKSLESIIAIIATIKLGAIFVPIDIEYPQERTEYILKDSNAKLILTLKEYENKLPVDNKKIEIDIENSSIYKNMNNSNPNYGIKPESLIYIMYTSGSTGKPKGVMIKHRNVVRLVKNTNYIDFSKCNRLLQTGSIVFDACTFEIWGALLNGLTLYIIKKNELLDTKILERYLLDNMIDTLWLTAPLFNQLSEENPYMFKKVKYLLTGGDVLSPRHINMVKDANPNITLINGYGPTENTTFSCCFTIDKKYEKSIPIGKPIANSTAYIVSKNGKIQPEGVPGELWVGGDGVGEGYLNRKELTAEKFIKNPFENGKVYKTGDLVKLLPDGNIEFIGRIDNQVKIRGFRVEISGIDNVIKQYPGILKLFTLVKEINGSKVLITYFTSDQKLNTQDILLYMQERLPQYMIPQYIVQLDMLPLTINGKVDKSQLPMPEIETKNKYVAPENEVQRQLCEIWCKIFNMKKVGIMDNFFEIGGDSLLAIKLQTEALKQNININYSDVFEYQTIKTLSEKKQTKKLYHIDENYDYSKINELIKINNISNIQEQRQEQNIKSLLLFGATGFLGAHILDEYLSNTQGNIYCLVRRKNNEDAEQRLKNILKFYFENKYDNEFGKRIFVVYGDITHENFGLTKKEYNKLGKQIDVVINSAALVKHFGDFEMFKSINVIGTQNVIKYCKEFNKKLYHVSTMSVAGISSIDEEIKNDAERILFGEDKFYIGQNLKNAYVYTKFQAEKEILEEISNGLEACILRMGNIFNRVKDGRFQINVSENAYINRIKSILKLGVVQNRFLGHALEFTPVDFSAKAIITIIKNNPKFNILHLFNTKLITFPNIIAILNNFGYSIQLVNDEEFSKTVKEFLKDEILKNQITGLIPDLNKNKTLSIVAKTLPDAYFSTLYLKSIGFEWPEIDKEYVEQFLSYFKKIGYIE